MSGAGRGGGGVRGEDVAPAHLRAGGQARRPAQVNSIAVPPSLDLTYNTILYQLSFFHLLRTTRLPEGSDNTKLFL